MSCEASVASQSSNPLLAPVEISQKQFSTTVCGYSSVVSDKWLALYDKNTKKFRDSSTCDALTYPKCGRDPFTAGNCPDCLLAGCPGWTPNGTDFVQGPGDSVCGQHKCRQWITKNGIYDQWLKRQNPKYQAYTWAFDELKCEGEDCGWKEKDSDNPESELSEGQCETFYAT